MKLAVSLVTALLVGIPVQFGCSWLAVNLGFVRYGYPSLLFQIVAESAVIAYAAIIIWENRRNK